MKETAIIFVPNVLQILLRLTVAIQPAGALGASIVHIQLVNLPVEPEGVI